MEYQVKKNNELLDCMEKYIATNRIFGNWKNFFFLECRKSLPTEWLKCGCILIVCISWLAITENMFRWLI